MPEKNKTKQNKTKKAVVRITEYLFDLANKKFSIKVQIKPTYCVRL